MYAGYQTKPGDVVSTYSVPKIFCGMYIIAGDTWTTSQPVSVRGTVLCFEAEDRRKISNYHSLQQHMILSNGS